MIHTQIIHLEVKGKTPSKSSAASSCVIERKVYKTNLVVDLLHIRVIIIQYGLKLNVEIIGVCLFLVMYRLILNKHS